MKQFFALAGLLFSFLPLSAGTLVQFRTVFGEVDVELYDQQRPITVSNFLHYVRLGSYSNSFFHRSVPGFVIQGGGFYVTDPGTTNSLIWDVETGHPITNEFHSGPLLSNLPGTIAMAKTSDPNSATSQFFFNLANNSSSLDNTNNSGGFTVFGKTVSGSNVLAVLNSFDTTFTSPTNLVVYLNDSLGLDESGPFGEVPLLKLNTNNLVYNPDLPATGTNVYQELTWDVTNLVYVDVTVLAVQVKQLPLGQHEISWGSVSSATNTVEFTSQSPPVWQTLTNIVRPSAPRSVVTDRSPDPRRFYRVRASF